MSFPFTALVEQDGPWFIATCPEVPEANGQGKSKEACLEDLRAAVELVMDMRREEALSNKKETQLVESLA